MHRTRSGWIVRGALLLALGGLAACGSAAPQETRSSPAPASVAASAPPTTAAASAPASAAPTARVTATAIASPAASVVAEASAAADASPAAAASGPYAGIPQSKTPEGYHMLGAPDAPVLLMYYSDFI